VVVCLACQLAFPGLQGGRHSWCSKSRVRQDLMINFDVWFFGPADAFRIFVTFGKRSSNGPGISVSAVAVPLRAKLRAWRGRPTDSAHTSADICNTRTCWSNSRSRTHLAKTDETRTPLPPGSRKKMVKASRAFVQAALQRIRTSDVASECRHAICTTDGASDVTDSQQVPERPDHKVPEAREKDRKDAPEHGSVEDRPSILNRRRHIGECSCSQGAVLVQRELLQRIFSRRRTSSYALLVFHCWR
jgi:hypothetical protein